MEEILELFKKIGLTEYEAKVYLALINKQVEGASRLARESKVPRTRIYSVLESLEEKGWIRIYSGYPLLFLPIPPEEILVKLKEKHDEFLKEISKRIDKDVLRMKEKFVISNYNIGLSNLKAEVKKAKTVWMTNATTELLKKLEDGFSKNAEIRVILFPGEQKVVRNNISYKQADMKIVYLVKGKEAPATSIVLDEERIFTAFKDPFTAKYLISEMLYEDCTQCFREWYKLGWGE